jgi:hypothetical protein
MKKLILTLALLSTQAFAQPATPEQVASECIYQMEMGVCRARPDRATIAPGQTMLISGVGRVSYSAYADYMDLFNEAVPSDPAMCDLAMHYMTTQPGGDHDKIARALWTPIPRPEVKQSSVDIADAAIKAAMLLAAAGATAFVIRRKVI